MKRASAILILLVALVGAQQKRGRRGPQSTPDPVAGLLQDYYAWTWGDALFVVLDTYWPTKARCSIWRRRSQSFSISVCRWKRRSSA